MDEFFEVPLSFSKGLDDSRILLNAAFCLAYSIAISIAMELKHGLGEIQSNGANLVHGRLLE
jgi:hypothetical protein